MNIKLHFIPYKSELFIIFVCKKYLSVSYEVSKLGKNQTYRTHIHTDTTYIHIISNMYYQVYEYNLYRMWIPFLL